MSTKDKAKAFMFVSVGVLALTITFQLGVSSVQGQTGNGQVIGMSLQDDYRYPGVILDNGDIYKRTQHDPGQWEFLCNFYAESGVVPAASESWGSLKAKSK
jgi:hypothetical protein